LATLLDDLDTRGMLERTLVVVMGEFGRSPKVNAAAGRDHWNFGYSLWLAGGGIRAGYGPIGMLERTLVVVMGEFGRSPKVNAAAGRDHWNFGYSLWLAGGGIRSEYV